MVLVQLDIHMQKKLNLDRPYIFQRNLFKMILSSEWEQGKDVHSCHSYQPISGIHHNKAGKGIIST